MTSKPEDYGNHLLDLLPRSVAERLLPGMDTVELAVGATLRVSGQVARHAYFPLDCTLSLLNLLRDGSTTEVAAVGNEGMVGVPVVLGGASAVNQVTVTMGGRAWQVDAGLFEAELGESSELRVIMLRYVQSLLTQVAQNAVCLRHHSIEQRLARWLLQASDRGLSSTLRVTHDAIANALGVRREGITIAVNKLHQLGLVKNHRARIQVLDREHLQATACECYAVVHTEHRRLLSAD